MASQLNSLSLSNCPLRLRATFCVLELPCIYHLAPVKFRTWHLPRSKPHIRMCGLSGIISSFLLTLTRNSPCTVPHTGKRCGDKKVQPNDCQYKGVREFSLISFTEVVAPEAVHNPCLVHIKVCQISFNNWGCSYTGGEWIRLRYHRMHPR